MTLRNASQLLDALKDNVVYHPDRRDPIYFKVHCLDLRKSFNRLDVLISPVTGSGQTWVAFDSLVVMGNADAIRAALVSI